MSVPPRVNSWSAEAQQEDEEIAAQAGQLVDSQQLPDTEPRPGEVEDLPGLVAEGRFWIPPGQSGTAGHTTLAWEAYTPVTAGHPFHGWAQRGQVEYTPDWQPQQQPGHRRVRSGPVYHGHSNPPGYKIWVGDLPAATTDEGIAIRIRDTMTNQGIQFVDNFIRRAQLHQRTTSGAKYVVITVSELQAAEAPTRDIFHSDIFGVDSDICDVDSDMSACWRKASLGVHSDIQP